MDELQSQVYTWGSGCDSDSQVQLLKNLFWFTCWHCWKPMVIFTSLTWLGQAWYKVRLAMGFWWLLLYWRQPSFLMNKELLTTIWNRCWWLFYFILIFIDYFDLNMKNAYLGFPNENEFPSHMINTYTISCVNHLIHWFTQYLLVKCS